MQIFYRLSNRFTTFLQINFETVSLFGKLNAAEVIVELVNAGDMHMARRR